ncbi:MAG: 30S ribosome-binding factor RbfA [Spirochaetia bacterium]|nr:30S ribosome-binding factor RbfA [Spirochaetia bacterium]MCF7946379.1 30S ribosome-binding factor RbfA [Spirochaetia bacterium]
MSEFKAERIASYIQEAVSSLILQGELKDPRISRFIQVNRVEVSHDTSSAKVFVSTFEDEEVLNSSTKALQSAAGFIQKKIAKHVKTRNTPRLIFISDNSIKNSIKVNSLIDHLHDEEDSDE